MHLISAGRSDIGRKRETNEDFLAAVDELGLYLVADGLGGHVAGRIASETGGSTFIENLYLNPGEVPAQGLRRACRGANNVIRERADADDRLWGMGTTLVSLWIRDGYATLAHVGDSRAYLLREQKLVGELVLRRLLTPGQARSHPHRHVITRALGVRSSVEPDLARLLRKVAPNAFAADTTSFQRLLGTIQPVPPILAPFALVRLCIGPHARDLYDDR